MSSFWHFLVWACVIWYGGITVFVAIRGWKDILGMLKRLREEPPD